MTTFERCRDGRWIYWLRRAHPTAGHVHCHGPGDHSPVQVRPSALSCDFCFLGHPHTIKLCAKEQRP